MELAEPGFLDETAGFHLAVLVLDCPASHGEWEAERDAIEGVRAQEKGDL